MTAIPRDETVLDGEVLLYGERYPLYGLVKRKSISPFPQKTTQGDYSRADRIIESEWVVSDLSGGLGIRYARPERDEDRSDIGDLEARYRYLCLGPEVVRAGTIQGPADLLVEFNERLYAAIGMQVWRWEETAGDWSQATTLPGVARASAVFDGALYLITDAALIRYDAGTDTWVELTGVGGTALVAFEDKLYRLDGQNQLWWSVAPSADPADWEPAGTLPLPPGYCRQLLVFWDQTGQPAIHAATKRGIFGYDTEARRFYPTPVQHPPLPDAEAGTAVWQSALWKNAGSGVYQYTGDVVRHDAGPDRDDGLPAHLQGEVISLVPGHGFLFAVVGAVQTPDEAPPLPWDLGTLTADTFLSPVTINGGVLASTGAAWHLLTQRLGVAAMGDAAVAVVEGTFRLWFSDSEGIWYIDQPTGLHNPMQNPTTRHARTGFIETPWHDMKWAEVDKVALSLDVEAEGISPTETVTVYLAWDGREDWERVAVVDGSGTTRFRIGGETGRIFRTVKMRIVMERGDDPTATPVLKSATLGYLLAPDSLDGWELTLDLTEPRCSEQVGVPAGELVERLYAAKARKRAGTLVYRAYPGAAPTMRRVWFHEVVGAELSGNEAGGRYSVTLVELDS